MPSGSAMSTLMVMATSTRLSVFMARSHIEMVPVPPGMEPIAPMSTRHAATVAASRQPRLSQPTNATNTTTSNQGSPMSHS